MIGPLLSPLLDGNGEVIGTIENVVPKPRPPPKPPPKGLYYSQGIKDRVKLTWNPKIYNISWQPW